MSAGHGWVLSACQYCRFAGAYYEFGGRHGYNWWFPDNRFTIHLPQFCLVLERMAGEIRASFGSAAPIKGPEQ
jgi:hypothetical protein